MRIDLGAVGAVVEEGRERCRVAAGGERLLHAHEERADSVGWLRRGGQGPPRRHDDEEPRAGSHGDGPGPTDRRTWTDSLILDLTGYGGTSRDAGLAASASFGA